MEHEYITINEASKLTGKSIKTIHRYIKKELLHVKTGYNHNKEVMTVEKEELIRVLKIDDKTGYDTSKPNDKTGYDNVKTGYNPVITRQNLKETFREFLEEQKTQLLKPLEEQAIYLVGELRNEVKHLQAEKDTLRQENEVLREQVKALPDKAYIEKMQKENQEKEKDLIIQIEMERKEKEDLKSMGETIQKETEEKLKQSEEIHGKELETRNELHREELKQAWKQAEEEGKNYLATIEELKKRLEAEEKKPWYRRLFS